MPRMTLLALSMAAHLAIAWWLVLSPQADRDEGEELLVVTTQLVEVETPGRVKVKEFAQRNILGHALFFPPLQGVESKLSLDEWDTRCDGVRISQLLGSRIHVLAGHHSVDARPQGISFRLCV